MFFDRQADIISALFYSFNCRSYDRKLSKNFGLKLFLVILGLVGLLCIRHSMVYVPKFLKWDLLSHFLLCVVPYLIVQYFPLANCAFHCIGKSS